MLSRRSFLALAALLTLPVWLPAQEPAYTRTEDVIYGRKFGTALTMDVFTPKANANGRGVIVCVSGGWFSAKSSISMNVYVNPLIARGYTVFAVMHGSAPLFTVPEAIEDMHRAVRYIRLHAADYKVDPDKLGVTGGSAGGHLSLSLGVGARPANPKAPDPVDREASRVAAVACFFPPTDFFNYGKDGELALGVGPLAWLKSPFDFRELDPAAKRFSPVTDEEKRKAIGKAISPAYHVSKTSAPALVVHGDKDRIVPLQQAELIAAKYKAAGVPFELIVKPGADHGWAGMDKDVNGFADFFDKHLLGKS